MTMVFSPQSERDAWGIARELASDSWPHSTGWFGDHLGYYPQYNNDDDIED